MGVTCDQLVLGRGGFRLRADWSLPDGATLALIGASGAGKSLFLGGLAGFDEVHSGRIEIGGADVADMRPADRPMTIMFQDHNLFPHLRVSQNVGLGIDPGLRIDTEGRAAIDAALGAVDLAEFADRYPSELSGGQQSRVALARALIRRRGLLLLDEPFAALGPRLRRDMLDLVMRIRAEHKMTLIFVTHAPEDAKIAEFAGFVHDGVVAAPVETGVFFSDPPEALRDYL